MKLFWQILIGVLVLFVLGVNMKLLVDKKKYQDFMREQQFSLTYLTNMNKLYRESIEFNIKGNRDSQVNEMDVEVVKSGKKEKQSFRSLIQNHPRALFFRFTEMECATCYITELKLLNSLKDSLNLDVQLLVTFKQIRMLNKVLKDLSMPQDYILAEEGALDFILEEYHAPYYFRVNDEFRIYSAFVPSKELPSLTRMYLSCASN